MRVNDLGEFEARICLLKVKNGKHENNVRNLLKVTNNDTRRLSC